MDKNYKVDKRKCAICGKTVKKVLLKNTDFNTSDFYRTNMQGKEEYICKTCESRYRVMHNYNERGYGYKYSTTPRRTAMDTLSTPTFGVEIEVAGNIKNIDKIWKLAEDKTECSIGYDTSVEGAQFELSYAPGTYYWYLYESKLRAICSLLQKDKWTDKESESIGTHIHVGNIQKRKLMCYLQIEELINPFFWSIIRAVGERDFNEYCEPQMEYEHHDAISYSGRWGTVEFRFFSGTYDFNKIMQRMRFLRQIINNASKDGINWYAFKKEVKDWTIKIIENSDLLTQTEIENCIKLFNEERKQKEYEDPNKIESILEEIDAIDRHDSE